MRARLYIDEDIDPQLALLLRARGHDVVSAAETRSRGETDEQQFARARLDHRAILTFNFRDFVPLSKREAAANREHPGIIVSWWQYRGAELGTLVGAVEALLSARSAESLRNALAALETPALVLMRDPSLAPPLDILPRGH